VGVKRSNLASYEGGADHDGAVLRPRDTCSGPTLGKKVGSPTSAAKVMTSRSELRSCCIETLRMFPEPQAESSTRTLAICSAKRLRRPLSALFSLIA
jgi:hypothetical protein